MQQIIALIDIGSLKVKCEARAYDEMGSFETVYREKVRTALVRGLESQGNQISEEALRATIAALRDFKEVLEKLGVTLMRVIGTEAIRRAHNADEVLSVIQEATGFVVHIITQEEEGELFFQAVSAEFPNTTVAAIDIGGGSVQVIIGRDGDILKRYLFSTGTYLTRNTYVQDGLPTTDGLNRAQAYIHDALASLAQSSEHPEYLVYGSTNVIDFMRELKVPLRPLPALSDAGVGYAVVSDLRALVDRIAPLSYTEREKLYPDEPYYMHGADMALFNVLSASTYLAVDKVVPTNHNVSSGMFLVLARDASKYCDSCPYGD